MVFNINFFTRLRQIAFFVPNVIREKYETEYSLPPTDSFPIEDNNIREQFIKTCSSVGFANSDSFFNMCTNYMKITDFEFMLFHVCLNVYMDLADLFSPYEKNFSPRKKTKRKREYGLEDDPEGFYNSIPRESFTKEMVKEKSQGMFLSVRKACHFYCMFTPSYWLFFYSISIKQHKNDIPLLKLLRDELANYLCGFPVESFAKLIKGLSDLSEIIKTYDTCKKSFNELQEEDRFIWNQWIKTIYDGVMIQCFNVAKDLSAKSKIPVDKRFFKVEFPEEFLDELDYVSDEEKKRRKKISDSQNKRLYKRKEKVQEHVNSILSNKGDQMSVKDACNNYFEAKKAALKKINITSARTLQNLCSHTKPNKQRSYFFERSYANLKFEYPKDFQKTIEKRFHDRYKDFDDNSSE